MVLKVALVFALLAQFSFGARIESSKGGSLTVNSQQDEMPSAAIKRVIDMLDNLIAEMDAEQASDEKQFAEFSAWCTRQQQATQDSIEALQTLIEDLTAALAKLYAQKSELEAQIAKLNEEIETTRTQIQTATEKRNEEHARFVAEQNDFDNSIAACGKAIDILKQHYGDGTVEEAKKPDFMTLIQGQVRTMRHVLEKHARPVPKFMSLLQQPMDGSFLQAHGGKDRYGAKTGDALNIVDQMKILQDTFVEDKQSAIDEENKLQNMYNTLMQEKTELLNSLIKERDDRQATLNAVNQEIAEKETAKANAEAELKDEQTYLATIKKLCSDTAILFEARKKDRAEEKLATQEAIKVLGGDAGEALLQRTQKQGMRLMQTASRHQDAGGCPKCRKAASMLSESARTLRSGLLATAAAATMGTDAVMDVVHALEGLIERLDEDQKMETAHKNWCEEEMAATAAKQAHHEALVEEFTQKIADETETVAEKKQGIADTIDAIKRADDNMAELTRIRAEEKAKFEEEQANYRDAINALNQAIDILSKFYASKKSFAQISVAPREMAPGVFDNVYQQKGGSGVIDMISTVRTEYETGKADLEKAEAQAIVDFTNARDAYRKARADLVSQQDRLEVELQTAEANLSQFQEDKASNEAEVAASKAYMLQLKASCDSLLEHYDDRVKLRQEEKAAINKAIDVLKNET
eukprot:gnl/MRDRNA2_/MRDRNA2_89164_c0_seq1.p1 gnl/MRDRNA2_/MRDRNA2_89164_c0~~gnl/MRDRNA2_/MRDRNA2_89164_c0_seq1.p1  ORF type:complete len:696 (-),score=239.32 gnl/MRDRNA2_/MRDRNA2_89164_c0_seq1:7-2094(-)